MKLEKYISLIALILLLFQFNSFCQNEYDFDVSNDLGRRMTYYYKKLSNKEWVEAYSVLDPEVRAIISLENYVEQLIKKYDKLFPLNNGKFIVVDRLFLDGGRGYLFFIRLNDNSNRVSKVTRYYNFRDIWIQTQNGIFVIPNDFYKLDYEIKLKYQKQNK